MKWIPGDAESSCKDDADTKRGYVRLPAPRYVVLEMIGAAVSSLQRSEM